MNFQTLIHLHVPMHVCELTTSMHIDGRACVHVQRSTCALCGHMAAYIQILVYTRKPIPALIDGLEL